MRAHAAIAIAVLLLARTTEAAVIRGTIRVPPIEPTVRAARNPYPGRASALPQPAQPPRGAVADAVVYLDGPAVTPSASPDSTRPAARLAQVQQAFHPRVLPILAGTRVEFPNFDPVYHNVFSVSPAKRFDLGKYGRGKSRRVLFSKPGLVNVFCDLHTGMEAFVLVLPTRCFTQPDSSGAFALTGVPAGTHRLKAWHPDFGERVVPVDVAEGSDERSVEIAF